MIIGLGSDLVNIERIRRSIEGLGERWVKKVLVSAELERTSSWNDAVYVAKLFAAKEACSKALGTGMTNGVRWHDFEIVLPDQATLSDGAARHLNKISGKGQQALVLLNVSQNAGFATAIVVIQKSPLSR